MKIEGNIGSAVDAGFLKYAENAANLPVIADILNGSLIQFAATYSATLDMYYLILQNLVYAISTEHRRKTASQKNSWQAFAANSVDFICSIPNFPLELKKSFIDQLSEIGNETKQFLYSNTRNQNLSKLLQELEYIK